MVYTVCCGISAKFEHLFLLIFRHGSGEVWSAHVTFVVICGIIFQRNANLHEILFQHVI